MAQKTTAIGRYAQCKIAGVVVAECFDWELTMDAEHEDVTAHGDEWTVLAPLSQGWTFRARGYIPLNTATFASGVFNVGAAPTALLIVAYTEPAVSGAIRFQGTGYPTRFNLSAPMELIEQEIEVRGTGAPVTIA
jgi:hypothetical protein